MMQNFAQISDRELYEKCKLYGANARTWAKKFAAFLPEVEKRQLYKKHGFYSIFEFAAKLAGMRRETVLEVLRVARKLEDMPFLKAQMETEGWGKLKVIANIATPENEKNLAEKVKEMSKATLETFVNELKKQNHELVKNRPGAETAGPQLIDAEHMGPPRISVRMPLKPQTELRLRQLQKKLSREQKAPVDFNEVIETLLDAYEKRPRAETKKSKHTSTAPPSKIAARELPKISSRYIPAKVKKLVTMEHGGRCAYPDCKKLPEIYHHTRHFLAPLCKNHERLAHHGLIENEEQPPEQWQVKIEADKTSPKYWIDRKVNEWRVARSS